MASQAAATFRERLRMLELPQDGRHGDVEGCRCPLLAFPKSGSTWVGRLLKRAVSLACWGFPKRTGAADGFEGYDPQPYKYHCLQGWLQAPALAHMLAWEELVSLFDECIQGLPPFLVMLLRDPYDNIISKTVNFPWIPIDLHHFGLDLFMHAANATPCPPLDSELANLPGGKRGLVQCSLSRNREVDYVFASDEAGQRYAVFRHDLLDYGKALEVFWFSKWHHAARVAAARSGRRVLTLLYEDLLDDPKRWLRRAMRFCGIPINDSALRYVMADSGRPTPGQLAYKHHGLFSEEELRWNAEVLLNWDPTSPPWLVEETTRRTRWAVHPRNRQSSPWGRSYLFDGVASA